MGAMASPTSVAGLAGTMAMWTVMMALMMLPATIPVMSVVARGSRAATALGEPSTPPVGFVGGYLLVWTLFSGGATLLQAWLASAMWLGGDLRLQGDGARGAALMIAGGWQLTPWKHACLSRCRIPLAFALHRWRTGLTGAVGMGVDHGLSCLGCCWALMLVLFATGVMNVAAVAALAVLVVVERIVAAGRTLGVVAGIGLIAWGLVLTLG
jgi:predicted metal-binding membrane protein